MADLLNSPFLATIARSNKELRHDRAMAITKSAEKALRRKIEDFSEVLENLQLDLDNLLDINPSNTNTIINPSDFDADAYITTAENIDLKMRDIKIRKELAQKRYDALFSYTSKENK